MQYNVYQMVEGQFLSKCITENDYSAIDKYGITNEYFSEQLWDENDKPTGIKNSSIFDFIVDYYKKYSTMPSYQTVQAKFYAFTLYEITDSWKYLVDQLQEHKCLRDCNELINGASKYDSSQQALDYIKNGIEIVVNKNKKYTEEFDIAHEGLKEVYKMYKEDKSNRNKSIMTTGLNEMDKYIGGWLREGELAIIQGFMGSSKTFLLMKMLFGAWEAGNNVCLFEPEMTIKEISYRWISFKEHFSNWQLNFGEKEEEPVKLYMNTKPDENAPKFLIITPSMITTRNDKLVTIDQLRKYCIDHNIDLLGIDGLSYDYVYDEGIKENEIDYKKLGYVCEKLVDVSRELKMPIISTIQRQRGPMESEIDNSTVSGSKRIPEIATKMFALRRIKGDKTSTLVITTTKNRFGPDDGVWVYEVDLDTQHWAFMGNTDPTPKKEKQTQTQSKGKPRKVDTQLYKDDNNIEDNQ